MLAVLCASSAISAAPVSAQESQVQITSVETDAWPNVQATVTVLDSAGQPVTGLTAADFNASFAEAPLPVTALTTTSDPSIGIAVVLVFDLSGSMAGDPLAQAKIAGKALIDQLGATDQAAVLAFANAPVLVTGFSADKAALGQAIDSLAAGGNTALYAGVQQSAALTQQAPLPRRAVVVLSDGVDIGAAVTTTREASLQAAGDSGALFMAIGLGADIDADYLGQLATVGNGQFLTAPNANDLAALYATVGNILRQQYVLTLDGSAVNEGAGSGALRVAARVGGVESSAEVQVSPPAQATSAVTASPAASAAATAPSTVAPAPEESGGSGSGLLIVGGIVALACVGGGAGFVLYRRRRQTAGESMDDVLLERRMERRPEPGDFPAIQRAVPQSAETGAWLDLPAGERRMLTEDPITLGFTADCDVQLEGATMDRARVWRRDGRYMLHNLSRLGSVTVSGRAVSWVILEDGDEIAVGAARVMFHEPVSKI